MPWLLSFFTWFGTAFTWLIKEFLPSIAKKFGLGAILGVIQKGVSFAVVAFVIAFFAAVINFALTMFSALSNFLSYINHVGNGGTWASCFVYMLNVSGISAGIQMAAPGMTPIL